MPDEVRGYAPGSAEWRIEDPEDQRDCSEFLGRLLNNPRQHSVPPFSAMDLQTGYAVLKDGCRFVAGHVSSWLDANSVFPMALTVRQLLGWAADYLVTGVRKEERLRAPTGRHPILRYGHFLTPLRVDKSGR